MSVAVEFIANGEVGRGLVGSEVEPTTFEPELLGGDETTAPEVESSALDVILGKVNDFIFGAGNLDDQDMQVILEHSGLFGELLEDTLKAGFLDGNLCAETKLQILAEDLGIYKALRKKGLVKELARVAARYTDLTKTSQPEQVGQKPVCPPRPIQVPREDLAWKERGACKGLENDMFFPERGEGTLEQKKICSGCPVLAECREYSITNGEKFGIWGGLSERERRRLRRQRSEGRKASTVISIPEIDLNAAD